MKGEGEARICPCRALPSPRRPPSALQPCCAEPDYRVHHHQPCPRALHHAFAPQDRQHRRRGSPSASQPASTMATACVAAPAVARPTMAVSGARKSAFFAGSAAMAAPRAATGALASARRQPAVIEARASKASTAGQQITVDVDKPLGLVGACGGQGLQCVRGAKDAAAPTNSCGDPAPARSVKHLWLFAILQPQRANSACTPVPPAGAGPEPVPQGRPEGEERKRQRRQGGHCCR